MKTTIYMHGYLKFEVNASKVGAYKFKEPLVTN